MKKSAWFHGDKKKYIYIILKPIHCSPYSESKNVPIFISITKLY